MSEQGGALVELRAVIDDLVAVPYSLSSESERQALDAELAAVEARIGRLDALTETAEPLAAQLDSLLSRGLGGDPIAVYMPRRQAESFVAAVKALRDRS